MKYIASIFSLILFCSVANAATTCSRANLTRCLDSACAINMSTNPSARCQYCGTSSAGTPPTIKGLRNVSVGSSAKYNISEKELKNAPSDPARRYIWATKQCIAKVSGCTTDDVNETYDKLIEQSCTAAGISEKMSELHSELKQEKTSDQCETAIASCMTDEKHCTYDWRACESDSDFDKHFAECSISDDATDCVTYVSTIKDTLTNTRNDAIKNANKLMEQIVSKYQSERENKFTDIKNNCKNNQYFENCVKTVCEKYMPYKCGTASDMDYPDEIDSQIKNFETIAAQDLCKFYKTACETLD